MAPRPPPPLGPTDLKIFIIFRSVLGPRLHIDMSWPLALMNVRIRLNEHSLMLIRLLDNVLRIKRSKHVLINLT